MLLAVVLAQGTIGLVQFWTGVPELLVSLHVLGAMSVIVATASLWCGVRDRGRMSERREGRGHTVAPEPQTA